MKDVFFPYSHLSHLQDSCLLSGAVAALLIVKKSGWAALNWTGLSNQSLSLYFISFLNGPHISKDGYKKINAPNFGNFQFGLSG